ncbi:MAG TPA: NnrS family protein, partial [Gammaproteobacteria bacterium]|nr:NnrS family protein [Gammaproteobacteria bacterium]
LAFICMGYALLSASYYLPYFHYFGIHALTYGGIGLVTFSMMARVSLGHTGHNVRAKNPKLTIALVIFTTGIVFRVLMPLFLPQYLDWWLMGAQLLWTLGFGCFLAIFTPILLKPSQ